jgi:hypothetical protein
MPSPQGRMTAGMMRKMAMLRKGTPKKSKAMPGFSKGTPKRSAPIPKKKRILKQSPFMRGGPNTTAERTPKSLAGPHSKKMAPPMPRPKAKRY